MTTFFDWTVTVGGVNVSQWVKAGGTIDYGRPTVFSGFQAPIARFELLTKDENPNPAPTTWPAIQLGDEVIIHVTWTGYTQSRRFTGIVQALDYSLYSLRVTATGVGTDWGRSWTGATGNLYPISIQNDLSRVNWLVTEAGKTVTVEGAAARWVREIPKNTTGTTLLDAVLRVAEDCDGLLLEDRLGVMRYRTKNFTRPDRVTIPANIVESTSLDLVIERGALVNSVAVYYGEPDPTTGVQKYAYAIDNTSVSENGEHRAELYTDLQYQSGAAGKADRHLEKNRLGWQVPDVTLLMNQATGAQADTILQLQENWRVTLSPLPEGCPIGSFDGDILGFTEVMHETDYRMILHLGMPVGDDVAPPEEPIFPEDSLTGGDTWTYEDQFAFLWQVHEWDTVGDFVATCANDVAVEALIVAGGGGGGGYSQSSNNAGGGGGAGGAHNQTLPLTAGTIAVKVGGGGAGGAGAGLGGQPGSGTKGGDSVFAGLTATGGGGGGFGAGGNTGTVPGGVGGDGGSGGGGGESIATTVGGGTGIPGQGTNGAAGGTTFGGAGGGLNLSSEITGTVQTYARGGDAGKDVFNPPVVKPANSGNGGDGAKTNTVITPGGAGASGTVIVRYRIG